MDEVRQWQTRPLEPVYPIVYVDCLVVKVRENQRVSNDEAVYKVVYLAICNIAKKWTMPIHNWKPALNHFAMEFEGRLPL